jgi:hypothetical protein
MNKFNDLPIENAMIRIKPSYIILTAFLFVTSFGLYTCNNISTLEDYLIKELNKEGLTAEAISAENFHKGIGPKKFEELSKAPYKPSYNEEPEIPAQCWIETSYGTQNACKYCHTNYLADIGHGNAYPIADDQITYSFPSENLNRILWQNIIYPQNIEDRLRADNIKIPSKEDVEYVRHDNWLPTYLKARNNNNSSWLNKKSKDKSLKLFPSLNPNHLFPYYKENPTNNGEHGYVDEEGFVRSEKDEITGWRALNFFPYAIFTPLTGSVSGVYIRLPKEFMTKNHELNVEVYKKNLDLLEKNIKNQPITDTHYFGDANGVLIMKGFYPVGTEFAHPLHYVDLLADGQVGTNIDGAIPNGQKQFEFPGTRSKRVKEIRYMYKWKEVNLEDIAINEDEADTDAYGTYIGNEGEGWIDNGAGWIIAAYIENRNGDLRPQTTEELAQCLGCHAKVGNTVDAIWSFQRKLPELEGWTEMNYGYYYSKTPNETKLQDYLYESSGMGELGYFYYTVVGADLYGVMPVEIREELMNYAKQINLKKDLGIDFNPLEILDDEILKTMSRVERKPRLLARQKLMRQYSRNKEYLAYNATDDKFFIKGNIFYPTNETMKANIQGYRKIVLDQSFNLGKDVFGSDANHIPFTFRSDGNVLDEKERIIPVGQVIYSRPYNEKGVGITPTGIIEGDAFDWEGNLLESFSNEDRTLGKITFSGTLDMHYNPILSGKSIRK